jgi:membrane protease YdiL (CAAX protease family)
VIHSILNVIRPVILSAFSFFLSFCLIQPIGLLLDPSFSLLANRGIGKVAVTLVVLTHCALLATTFPRKLWQQFIAANFLFIWKERWLKPFGKAFTLFFCLHLTFIALSAAFGLTHWNLAAFHPALTLQIVPALLLGFIATFFLAWTEEVIFRGTLYPFFAQQLEPLTSALLTSFIFMIVHDLTAPYNLVTTEWRLGLGLFLLGFLLNLIFIISGKLYVGMGAHAGLVFVKVLRRRIPFISHPVTLPWWFAVDLRQSLLVHAVFIAVIILLLCYYMKIRKKS